MMIRYSLALALLLTIAGGCGTGHSQNSATSLSAKEFAEKIKTASSPQVIDVRTPEEFVKGHLHDAKMIDWNGDDFKPEIAKLDKSRPVFVYCLSGGRSAAAARQMRSDGFKEVYELRGGILKWRAAGLPETFQSEKSLAGMSRSHFDSLITSDKLVLVDFYADWCAPCKKMKPYLDEISATMADMVVVVRINADDHQQLCKDLQIDTLPVLRLYKNNVLTWTGTGYISKEEVLIKLN